MTPNPNAAVGDDDALGGVGAATCPPGSLVGSATEEGRTMRRLDGTAVAEGPGETVGVGKEVPEQFLSHSISVMLLQILNV